MLLKLMNALSYMKRANEKKRRTHFSKKSVNCSDFKWVFLFFSSNETKRRFEINGWMKTAPCNFSVVVVVVRDARSHQHHPRHGSDKGCRKRCETHDVLVSLKLVARDSLDRIPSCGRWLGNLPNWLTSVPHPFCESMRSFVDYVFYFSLFGHLCLAENCKTHI